MGYSAEKMETSLNWNDLFFHKEISEQLEEVKLGLERSAEMTSRARVQRKTAESGHHLLFYGATGSGKALTAALLGKVAQKDVYKVDLSSVVSKYSGETERKLEEVFGTAERNHWILFFEEADSLFGKRSDIKDSHDRYANLEGAWLLQRLERHPGLVIFSIDKRTHLDDAFIRRFHSVVHFPDPL